MVYYEEIHSGPLPDPATLARYNELAPGLAERIIVMAENQQEHRHGMEQYALRSERQRTMVGLAVGGVLSLAGMGVAAILALKGESGGAIATVIIELGVLAGVFVYGTESRRSERMKKLRELFGR